MTRDEVAKMLPILTAYAQGKIVQTRDDRGGWKTPEADLLFTMPHHHYRIKPEPKLRAWQLHEVPVGAVVREKSDPEKRGVIVRVASDGVFCNGGWVHPMTLCAHYEVTYDHGASWKTCGVEESQ